MFGQAFSYQDPNPFRNNPAEPADQDYQRNGAVQSDGADNLPGAGQRAHGLWVKYRHNAHGRAGADAKKYHPSQETSETSTEDAAK